MPSMSMPTDLVAQQARLRQFFAWVLPATFGFAAVYAVIFIFAPSLSIGLAGLTTVILGLFLIGAWFLLRRGQLTNSVVTVCSALLVVAVLTALFLPKVYPILVLIPLLSVALGLPYLSGRSLYGIMLAAWLTTLAVILICEFVQILPPPPLQLLLILRLSGGVVAVALVLLLVWQFSVRLSLALQEARAVHGELQTAHAGLEAQVIERTATLHAALSELQTLTGQQARLLAENEQQRITIRDLSVPVLPVEAGILVLPLVGTLDQERIGLLQSQALQALEREAIRYLLVDVTGVPVVDGPIAQGLIGLVQAGRLLGSEVVLVGIRPEVAQAVVDAGLDLQGVRTFRDLQTALRRLSS